MKVNIDDVIGMAWSDKISFEEIKKRTGLKEAEVISIMRNNLKKNSYILWRKRVRVDQLSIGKRLEQNIIIMNFEPSREFAIKKLEDFIDKNLHEYSKLRNFDFGPEQRKNVSSISPYITHGSSE